MWKTYAPLPPFGPHKNLLNSNLVSTLISTAAEWIILSFDTPYYTELPQYSPKTEIENWVNMCHRRGCSFYKHNPWIKKIIKWINESAPLGVRTRDPQSKSLASWPLDHYDSYKWLWIVNMRVYSGVYGIIFITWGSFSYVVYKSTNFLF